MVSIPRFWFETFFQREKACTRQISKYTINNSYNHTGACAADTDCDTAGEVCKVDNTCGT